MAHPTAILELSRPTRDSLVALAASEATTDCAAGGSTRPVDGEAPLVEKIVWLLLTATGSKWIKKLFRVLLRFRPASEGVALADLPEDRRELVGRCIIFACLDGLHVCHAPLNVAKLSRGLETPVLHALAEALTGSGSAALVIFSNLPGTAWDFYWLSPGLKLCAARLRLGQECSGIGKLAHLLARFGDADSATGRVEAVWERARRFDEFLRGAVARRRQRRQQACDFGNGWLPPSPLLSLNEQLALAHRWRCRGDAEARQQLVLANLPRVRRIARQYRRCGLPLDDLIQEGCLGLVRALDTYQPDSRFDLKRCMNQEIHRGIQRALGSASFVLAIPRRFVELNAQWDRTEQRMIAATGRAPSPTEMRRALHLSRLYFRQLCDARRVLNCPKPHEALPDQLAAEADTQFFESLDRDSVQQGIEQALATLPRRSAAVIRCRFGLGADGATLTFEELAGRFNRTPQYMCHIEQQTCARLKIRLKRLGYGA